MRVVEKVDDLKEAIAGQPRRGVGVTFVPTMGALHDGHLSLLRRAAILGRPAVVSIFVNPSQFDRKDDLQHYPRTLPTDLEACAACEIDLVFTPAVETVYPPDLDIATPPLPPQATAPALEDAHRPGHFSGVCQVVARMFDLVRPAAAIFGEKDYQQLQVITAMVRRVLADQPDRWPSLEIDARPTVREPDGLAMSSRNRRIDFDHRDAALGLSRALSRVALADDPPSAEAMMMDTLDGHGLVIDYAAVRDATTLMPVASFDRPTVALIAARLGSVRLIDNRRMQIG